MPCLFHKRMHTMRPAHQIDQVVERSHFLIRRRPAAVSKSQGLGLDLDPATAATLCTSHAHVHAPPDYLVVEEDTYTVHRKAGGFE
jgi:hypothetical protein